MVWGRKYREVLLRCLPAPPDPIVLPWDWLCWWRVPGRGWPQAVGADGGHVMRGEWETWEEGRERGRERKKEGEEGGRGERKRQMEEKGKRKKE